MWPLIVLEKPSSSPPAHSSALPPLIPPSCSLAIVWVTLCCSLSLSSFLLPPSPPFHVPLPSQSPMWMLFLTHQLSSWIALLGFYTGFALPFHHLWYSFSISLQMCVPLYVLSLSLSIPSLLMTLCIFDKILGINFKPQSCLPPPPLPVFFHYITASLRTLETLQTNFILRWCWWWWVCLCVLFITESGLHSWGYSLYAHQKEIKCKQWEWVVHLRWILNKRSEGAVFSDFFPSKFNDCAKDLYPVVTIAMHGRAAKTHGCHFDLFLC